jgi:hypothetical protein
VRESPRFRAAISLLSSLSDENGIRASQSPTANYRAIFARDAVIAGMAGLLADNAAIVAGFVRTLERLRDLQGDEGQIPSNFTPEPAGHPRTSFGTLVPRIDATSWFLLGVSWAAHSGAAAPADYEPSVRRAVRLLQALEFNGRHLIWIPPGGNWADEYVYQGYILFDQVLRAWALRSLASVYDEPGWRAKAEQISETIATEYWPRDDSDRGYPLASRSPLGGSDVFDLAAATLLGVSGIGSPLGAATLDWISQRFLDQNLLPPAFHPVVDEHHPDYAALRRYHLYQFRNRPHEYHNGGVWPVWLGWLALALARGGRTETLDRLRGLVDQQLGAWPAFRFEEFLHGETGAPGGTSDMAYTASGLIFLEAADSVDHATWLNR